jgi:hypothetical protein
VAKLLSVAFALLLASMAAHAVDVEVGVGAARAIPQENGTWYQEGFPHSLNLRSPVFLLGVTDDLTPNVAWHVNAVSLGSYSVDSWDTPNDANYSGSGYRGNALPLAHYIGSGSVYGIAATLHAHTQGEWQFGVQAGPFIYHSTWSVAVPNWYPSAEVSPGVFAQTGPISPINVSQSQWSTRHMVGLTLRHGQFSAALAYYSDKHGFKGHGDDPWPPLWKGQYVLMILYSF